MRSLAVAVSTGKRIQLLTISLASRLASCAPRKDLLSDVIGKARAGEVSTEELTAHASTLV